MTGPCPEGNGFMPALHGPLGDEGGLGYLLSSPRQEKPAGARVRRAGKFVRVVWRFLLPGGRSTGRMRAGDSKRGLCSVRGPMVLMKSPA